MKKYRKSSRCDATGIEPASVAKLHSVILNETYAYDCVLRMHVCIMVNVGHHLEPVLVPVPVMWRHNPITRSVARISTYVPFKALKLHSCH